MTSQPTDTDRLREARERAQRGPLWEPGEAVLRVLRETHTEPVWRERAYMLAAAALAPVPSRPEAALTEAFEAAVPIDCDRGHPSSWVDDGDGGVYRCPWCVIDDLRALPAPVPSPTDEAAAAPTLARIRSEALHAAGKAVEDAAASLGRLLQNSPGDDAAGIEYAVEYLTDYAALKHRQAIAAAAVPSPSAPTGEGTDTP